MKRWILGILVVVGLGILAPALSSIAIVEALNPGVPVSFFIGVGCGLVWGRLAGVLLFEVVTNP